MKRAAIAVRMHSGWGALVAVYMNAGAIEVLDRRRLAVTEPGTPGAIQPYHFAQKLPHSEAQKYLNTCAAISQRLALHAVRDVRDLLEERGYRLAGCALLTASGRPLPSLSAILASHPMIHTAEGEFFRYVVRSACERLRIPVCAYRERDLSTHAKSLFRGAARRIQRTIANLGRTLGPPWTSDQKSAALAACLLLAGIAEPPY